MNIYKARDLISKEICSMKYHFDSIGINTIKNKYYFLSMAIKEAVKKEDTSIKFLDSILADEYFTPLSKKHEVELLSKQLSRYLSFLKSIGVKKISDGITQDINIDGKLITVSCDLILEHSDFIEIVKFKRGEPKLSYQARTYSNKPDNSIELFMLYLLGEHLYKDKKVLSSFHHMTSKNDKKDFSLNFEPKSGHNIIRLGAVEGVRRDNLKNQLMHLMKDDTPEFTLDTGSCRVCNFNNICNYKKPQEVELEKLKNLKKANDEFSLTKTQHSAVMFEEGIVRINAGAGSGKTTVIALRVVELINRGYKPEDILLVTFTNKGAAEMREKISHWLKKEGLEFDANRFNITTFNSWGDKVIQENFEMLGFTKIPRIIEKVEKYDILFDLLLKYDEMEDFDYKNPLVNFRYSKGVVVRLENMFNYMKSYFVTIPEQLKDIVDEKYIDQVLDMYKEYNEILKEKNLIEYQDQINLLVDLIEDDHEALEAYDYKHLIVDEFQDSDKMQMDIIMYLSNKPSFKSLMIVGDDSQSIYGFRNTSQENILSFHTYFKDVRDINMVENFRSTPQIINLANSIDELNSKRIDKKLVSGLKGGDMPRLKTFESSEAEYDFISEKINDLINKEGNNPEDIAVIARTKQELFELEERLKDLKVPYIIDIPEPLLNDSNIHIADSLLEFFRNNDITQGLLEYLYVINNRFKGMTKEDIKTLIEDTVDEIKDEMLLSKEDIRLNKFFEMLEVIEDDVFQKFLKGLKEKELDFDGLYDYLRKFIEYEDNKTLEKDNNRYRAVTLTTAHTSKGKEFEVVFATLSKFKVDTNDVKEVDEERRVVYVSLTRAKEKLFITSLDYCNKKLRTRNRYIMEIVDTKKVKIL